MSRIIYEKGDQVMITAGIYEGKVYIVIEVLPDGKITLAQPGGGATIRATSQDLFHASDPIML